MAGNKVTAQAFFLLGLLLLLSVAVGRYCVSNTFFLAADEGFISLHAGGSVSAHGWLRYLEVLSKILLLISFKFFILIFRYNSAFINARH